MKLTNEQKSIFHRNIIIPEVGEEGQEKLLRSSVLIIGCGGLGSASSLYLCAAGIGCIGLLDFDVVVLSNLQRQILYGYSDVGKPKTQTASAKLKQINPQIKIDLYQEDLLSDNLHGLFEKYDVIIDGSDNFPTRYAMNERANKAGKIIIMGAVLGFSGQVTTIIPGKTPCYRCLFPQPPPEDIFPQGRVMGIMGTSPGIIGIIQATEAIKAILNIGQLLTGKLLLFDGLSMHFDYITYGKNPICSVCGNNS